MSNEQLVERIKAGESDLILDLWYQIRKLVIKIILKRYLPRDGSTNRVELDDLIQAGFIGMMRAIDDFKPSLGYSFTTFLDKHLANAAREALGIRSKKRDPLIDAVSMDKPISSSEEGITLADTLQDQSSIYVYDDLIEELAQQEDIKIIFEQVKHLKPLEQEVFKDRFLGGLTLKAIGEKYGFTTEKVRSMISKSLLNIRKSKAVQMMSKERWVDRHTNFYAGKGLKAFNTTFYSAVEDIVAWRMKLRQSYNGTKRS